MYKVMRYKRAVFWYIGIYVPVLFCLYRIMHNLVGRGHFKGSR